MGKAQVMGDGKGLGTMVTTGSVTQWCLLTRNLEMVQNLLVEKNQKQGRWVTKRDSHTLPCGGEQHEDETPKHEWGLIGILGL